jgi:hypothetical protein
MESAWIGIGITVGGIILNAGIIYGILKTTMTNMSTNVEKMEKTVSRFGERLGKAEGDIQSRSAVCEVRHGGKE